MADVSSKLKVSELDFDTIKSNLKNFLSDQNEFADYDFDASAMSVLLDVLSYNTHYNAFYLNMIVNEMFLDTASIRNSVISRAKHLGYTPQSVRGAKAYVDLTITPADTPSTIIIAKDTQFASTANGISYIFSTTGSTTVNVNAKKILLQLSMQKKSYCGFQVFKRNPNVNSNAMKFLLQNIMHGNPIANFAAKSILV